jgi:hypothetical protein
VIPRALDPTQRLGRFLGAVGLHRPSRLLGQLLARWLDPGAGIHGEDALLDSGLEVGFQKLVKHPLSP